MSAASDKTEVDFLNYFFRKQAVAQPQTLYLALYISNPTDADTGTEVSGTGTGYTRQVITFAAPVQAAGAATISNNVACAWPVASADYGTVSHWGIRTAATGGNLLAFGAFSRAETILSGNRFSVEVGNLQLSVA